MNDAEAAVITAAIVFFSIFGIIVFLVRSDA